MKMTSPVSCLLAPGCDSFSPPPPQRSLCPATPGCWCCPNPRLQSSPSEALKRRGPLEPRRWRQQQIRRGRAVQPGKSAIKTISVWLSRLPSISWNFVLHGERSTSRGISHGLGRKGDQSAFTMSTRGSKILKGESKSSCKH